VGGRERLASASVDATVRVWDPVTGVSSAQIPTAAVALTLASFGTGSVFIGLDVGVLAVDLADQTVRQLRP
jgi:hypothetical protein